jgi:uncharacterized protein YjbJ (UPF0337 family)
MGNKDEVKGKAKQIKGAIKDKIGEVTNNPRLEAETFPSLVNEQQI